MLLHFPRVITPRSPALKGDANHSAELSPTISRHAALPPAAALTASAKFHRHLRQQLACPAHRRAHEDWSRSRVRHPPAARLDPDINQVRAGGQSARVVSTAGMVGRSAPCRCFLRFGAVPTCPSQPHRPWHAANSHASADIASCSMMLKRWVGQGGELTAALLAFSLPAWPCCPSGTLLLPPTSPAHRSCPASRCCAGRLVGKRHLNEWDLH